MASLIDDRDKFFEHYNINKDDFNKTGLEWDDLQKIYLDYLDQIPLLESTGKTIADILRVNSHVHSVRMRVKHPEHLIEKLIRKSIEKDEFSFDLSNYKEKITDLIGLRVLHLYKDQAQHIDLLIKGYWELAEDATIYFRRGDYSDEEINELKEKKYQPKEHPAGYRSWHYLIVCNLTKEKTLAEIQVRTIFEEGWSEIDHKLRYPYNLDNKNLNNQLMVLNRLAGSADEMVNSIVETLNQFKELNNENNASKEEISRLRKKIEQMDVGQPQKDSLMQSVNKLEHFSGDLAEAARGFRGLSDAFSGLENLSFRVGEIGVRDALKRSIEESMNPLKDVFKVEENDNSKKNSDED
ncbi:hypothetical protein MOC02_22470 [Bacillus inaquosorum]|uniref:hypothetical protein n=1 Tax=Bacillus subtilis group TaxID=653685 RepID=UPI000F51D1A6|nr:MULTISPECIES: hypothetical protein [Bacillus subtilis group]MCY8085980.1 hypothetical protein [Bacillus inaquosorum]MCY8705406.1 hypothetical protein [Bacillus inaquosorum]RPK02408.1 GTP pyrophosphokinase [Bacillus subtilis]RUS08615.1 GTP pyrophosphokinase [Bacillus subtilis]